MTPKAFISYSWTSESHRQEIRTYADQLLAEGVDVILDQYDLKEGTDKYAFMEKMVTDESVTHVLIFSDKAYAQKADSRKAGVGTESQIISQEVYNRVEQSKFIPIVCELSPDGEPYLPTFLKSRIWINFSAPEAVNENWEQLVRVLHGKPALRKPGIGKPPLYITDENQPPANPASFRLATLKQAFLQGKRGISTYRADFFDVCFQFADSLRVRTEPESSRLPEQVLDTCGKLVSIRDLITDWVLLEGPSPLENGFKDALSAALEQLLELRSRPQEVTGWNDLWFEAHRLFAYETFLYVVAALIKVGAFSTLHDLFTDSYLAAGTESAAPDNRFVLFDAFFASSQLLNEPLAPPGRRLLSPAATLMKRQSTRHDLPFDSIMQAELLTTVVAALSSRARWFPQTLLYAGYGRIFPLFVRAAQHKHFQNLALITGVTNVDDLRTKVKQGLERIGIDHWREFSFHAQIPIWEAANMDKLDSIQ